jgi:hypothetical protein
VSGPLGLRHCPRASPSRSSQQPRCWPELCKCHPLGLVPSLDKHVTWFAYVNFGPVASAAQGRGVCLHRSAVPGRCQAACSHGTASWGGQLGPQRMPPGLVVVFRGSHAVTPMPSPMRRLGTHAPPLLQSWGNVPGAVLTHMCPATMRWAHELHATVAESQHQHVQLAGGGAMCVLHSHTWLRRRRRDLGAAARAARPGHCAAYSLSGRANSVPLGLGSVA